MKDIILIGGGGHCRACIDVIEQHAEFKVIGIIDPSLATDSDIMGYPILGDDSILLSLSKKINYALVTVGQIGDGEKRKRLYDELLSFGFNLPTIISPLSYIGRSVSIGGGSIIMHGVIINACAKVGVNCIVNTRALIEHDVLIADHCHVSTGAIVNGGSRIETSSFLGSHSVVVQNLIVPRYSFVKANHIYKG